MKAGIARMILWTVAAVCFSAQAQPLPTAESLFARHVEAAYDENGLRAHTSIAITQEFYFAELGVAATMLTKRKAPDKVAVEGNLFGMSHLAGCNAGHCWEQSFGSDMKVFDGAALDRHLEEADYFRLQNMEQYYRFPGTVERETLPGHQGEEVFSVRLINKATGKENIFSFSAKSGLLLRTIRSMALSDGSFESRTTSYQDYEQYGPFLLPATAVETQPRDTITRTITSVSFDEIPDVEFEPPAVVREMLETSQ